MTTTETRPARWAVWCAWIVPVTVAPSAIWRAALVLTDDRGLVTSVTDGGWYLLLLSVLSLGLGLLTVGLVRPWGEVYPRWIPRLGGRRVPIHRAAGVAMAGGAILIVLTIWFFVFPLTGLQIPVLVGAGGPPHPRPGWEILRYYLPVVAWGPLVIAVALEYRLRHGVGPVPAHSSN